MQREANRQLGFTAEQTLEYVQSLYEKKLVTYPRTDSRYITDDMKDSIPTLIKTTAGFFMLGNVQLPINTDQIIDNSKVSDHHAIVTTMSVKDFDIQSLPFGEREVLLLIALRLVCAVGNSCRYAETLIGAKCSDAIFTTKGKTILDDGWKAVQKIYLDTKKEQSQEEKDVALPPVNQGEVFSAKSTIKEGKTSPPKHFTDDTLLSAMENANKAMEDTERKGIGTPATRAGILEKLIKTGLAERKGEKKTKHFIPTYKGISLITVLPEAIKSAQLTAEWEEKLKEIERGMLSPQTFLSSSLQNSATRIITIFYILKWLDSPHFGYIFIN